MQSKELTTTVNRTQGELPSVEQIQSIVCKFLLSVTTETQKTDQRLWFHYNQAFNYYIDKIASNQSGEHSLSRDRQTLYFALQDFLPQNLKSNFARLMANGDRVTERTLVAGTVIMDRASKKVLMVEAGNGEDSRKGKYGFCKGKLGEDEAMIDCARRQVAEQLQLEDIQEAGIVICPDQHFHAKTQYKEGVFFLAMVDKNTVDKVLVGKRSNPEIESISWIDISKGLKEVEIGLHISINAISKDIIQQIYESNPEFQKLRYAGLHSFIKVSDKKRQNKGGISDLDKDISREILTEISENNERSNLTKGQSQKAKIYSHQREIIQAVSQSLAEGKDKVKPLLILYTSENNGGNKVLMGSLPKVLKMNKNLPHSKFFYCSIFKADKSKINYFALNNGIKPEFIYLEQGDDVKLHIQNDTELVICDPYSLNEFLNRKLILDESFADDLEWENSILYIDISVEMYDTDMNKITQILSNYPPKIVILEYSYRIAERCERNLSQLIRQVYPHLTVKHIEAEKRNNQGSQCYTLDGSLWFPHKGVKTTEQIYNLLQCIRSTPRIQNAYNSKTVKLALQKLLKEISQLQIPNSQTQHRYLEFIKQIQKISKQLELSPQNKLNGITKLFETLSTHEQHIRLFTHQKLFHQNKNVERIFEKNSGVTFFTADPQRFVDKCIISVKDPQKFAKMLCGEWVKNINISQIRKRIAGSDCAYYFETSKKNKSLQSLKQKFYEKMNGKYLQREEKEKILCSQPFYQRFFKNECEEGLLKDYARNNSHMHVYDAINPNSKLAEEDFDRKLLFAGIVVCAKRMAKEKKEAVQRFIYDDFPALIITDDLMKALTMSSYRTVIVHDSYFCDMSEAKTKEVELQKQLIPRIFGRKQSSYNKCGEAPLQTFLDVEVAEICTKFICQSKSLFNTPNFLLSTVQHHFNFPQLCLRTSNSRINHTSGTLNSEISISMRVNQSKHIKTVRKVNVLLYLQDAKGNKGILVPSIDYDTGIKSAHLPKKVNNLQLSTIDKSLYHQNEKAFIGKILLSHLHQILQTLIQDSYLVTHQADDLIQICQIFDSQTGQLLIPIRLGSSISMDSLDKLKFLQLNKVQARNSAPIKRLLQMLAIKTSNLKSLIPLIFESKCQLKVQRMPSSVKTEPKMVSLPTMTSLTPYSPEKMKLENQKFLFDSDETKINPFQERLNKQGGTALNKLFSDRESSLLTVRTSNKSNSETKKRAIQIKTEK